MKNKGLLKSLNFYYIILGALAAFSLLTFFKVAFAAENKCYGQYGQEIACPLVNKSFSIEKTVRIAGSGNTFTKTVSTSAGNNVEFKLVVKNTGEAKVSDVKVSDLLPANLTLAQGSIDWTINDFEPGSERVFSFVAKTNSNGIADNQEKCVANVGNVAYKGHQEASDTAVVCITKGKILSSITNLPETAFSAPQVIGIAVVMVLLGLLVHNISLIIEHKLKTPQR